MGLFSKKKKEVGVGGIPTFPELPKLPTFPVMGGGDNRAYKLPSFPNSSLGTNFSQNTIKNAVAGVEEEYDSLDEFATGDENESQMMQEPVKRQSKEMDEFTMEDENESQMMQEPVKKFVTQEMGMRSIMKTGVEPVFVRIDKFEEALKTFRETKRRLSDIERVLEEIKKLKDKEDGELRAWENEMRSMKDKIEKVDKDIFSKI